MEFEKEEEEKKIFNANQINKWVNNQETNINKKLFKNHFSFQTPSVLLKELYKTNDKEKNRLLVSVINSGLKDVKEKMKKMSEEERKIEKPDKRIKIVKKNLNFNQQNQEEKGLKTLAPTKCLVDYQLL